VFLPGERQTTLSADVHFPPPATVEGPGNGSSFSSSLDSGSGGKRSFIRNRQELHNEWPVLQQASNSQTPTVNLEYKANRDGFPTDPMWIAWMDSHPETANKWYDEGHPKVVELFRQENARGKRDGFLGLPYWLPDDNTEATVLRHSVCPISTPDGSVVPSAVSPPGTANLDISMRHPPLDSSGSSQIPQQDQVAEQSKHHSTVQDLPDVRSFPGQHRGPGTSVSQRPSQQICFV